MFLSAVAIGIGTGTGAAATPGSLNTNFNFSLPSDYEACEVDSFRVQSTGSIVLAGLLTQSGATTQAVWQTTSSGAFATNVTITNGSVPLIDVQADGKVLVSFLQNGSETNWIYRYNADLSRDSSFSADCQVYHEAQCLLVENSGGSVGNIILGGAISKDSASSVDNLIRFMGNGTFDHMFFPFVSSWSRVNLLVEAPDHSFYVAGESAQADGTIRARLERHFWQYGDSYGIDFGTGANGTIRAMVADTAGRVVIGGDFTEVQGVARNHIARLQANGQLDPTFDPGVGADGSVLCLALQGNGKVCLGGSFNAVAGVPRHGVARLNSEGSLDATFDPGLGIDGGAQFAQPKVTAMAFRAAGELLVGGWFAKYDGSACQGLVLIHANEVDVAATKPGALDLSYVHANASVLSVSGVYPQPNGKIVVSGVADFGLVHPYFYVWQTDAGGAWTTAGDMQLDVIDTCGFLQSDGKVLLSSYLEWHSSNPIVRYNLDFSQDSTFSSPGCGPFAPGDCNFGGHVLCLGRQSDGKIIVGGYSLLSRLADDGTREEYFPSGLPSTSSISRLVVQPDDGFIIAGDFTTYGGVPRVGLARLKREGALDVSFDPGAGADGAIRAMGLDSAGRLVIAGDFTTVQGVPRSHVARLFSNGQLDTTFDPGTGPNDSVYCLAIQANGKICLGGTFTNLNGALCNRIARLNADGTPDASFVTGSGVEDGAVAAMGLDANGDIIIGGTFTLVQGQACAKLARIHGDPIVARPRLAGWQKEGESFRFEVQGSAKGAYVIQTSTNLVDWQTCTNLALDGGVLPLTNALPAGDRGFYRLISQ